MFPKYRESLENMDIFFCFLKDSSPFAPLEGSSNFLGYGVLG